MAYAVSISDSEEDIWMASNQLAQRFVAFVLRHYQPEEDVAGVLRDSLLVHGLALDQLGRENPRVAKRLQRLLHRAAIHVSRENTPVATTPGARKLFGELASLLEKL